MNYDHFFVSDFMADEYFIKWVNEPDEESTRFWKEWIARHPEKKACLEEAREAVRRLSDIEPIQLSEARVQDMKAAIDDRIGSGNALKVITLKKGKTGKIAGLTRGFGKRSYRYAAALAGIILLSAAVYLFRGEFDSSFEYTTDYGETKTLTLPDGSKVILNANSQISYARDWNGREIREVWLKGEAFFSVERMLVSKKFIVHTNNLHVEVLGTKFNVNNRESKTRVVLNSGKIKLSVPLEEDTTNIIMKPGELVQYTEKDHTIIKKAVEAGNYISWISDELVLDNTPLQEISETLENNYGITIILIDEMLARRTITATLPTGDLDFILKALSETLNVRVTERGEDVYILTNDL